MNKSIFRNECLLAFALYLAAVVIAYLPAVFLSKSLQPSLYSPHGITESWPYGFDGRTPENTFSIDLATPAYFEWPVNRLVGDIYKKGELPLWNPYQAAGTPLAAQYSTRAFFPYQIIEDISPAWSWDFYLVGRLIAAGFFTFMFLRSLGLSFSPAIGGGLAYMLSGAFTWFINLEQFANTGMMIPVYMLALERLVKFHRTKEMAIAGVSTGLVLLAGQPETAFFAVCLGVSYYLFRALQLRAIKRVIGFLVSSAIGFLIAAPLLLPFVELEANGHHLHPAGGEMGLLSIPSPFHALGLMAPAFYEFPQGFFFLEEGATNRGGQYLFSIFPYNGYWDFLGGYTGAIVLFLALSGVLLSIKNRSRLWPLCLFTFLFGLSIVLKNFGFRPFVWLGYLPLFDQAWSQRWAGPVWVFAFAVSAGAGLEVLKERFSAEARKGWADRALLAATAAAVSGLLLLLSYVPLLEFFGALSSGFSGESVIEGKRVLIEDGFDILLPLLLVGFALLAVVLDRPGGKRGSLALLALLFIEQWWAIPRGYAADWTLYKLIPLATGLAAVISLFFGRYRAAIACTLAFAISFALVDSYSQKGFPERYDPFTKAPYVRFLEENAGEGRVVGGHGMLFPNFSSALGIQDVRYINSLSIAWFQAFKDNYLQREEERNNSLWFTGRKAGEIRNGLLAGKNIERDFVQNLRGFSLLGVRYIVMPPGVEFNSSQSFGLEFPIVYSGADASIFENPYALPRAFVARGVIEARSFESAQEIVHAGDFDIRNNAVIEGAVPAGVEPIAPGAYNDSVRISAYRTNSVEIDASLESDGLLVLTDVFYPGWKAYVDGAGAEVYRVDGLVRGVFLKKGSHRVEFVYRPFSFMAGAALFVIGVVAVLVLLVKRRN